MVSEDSSSQSNNNILHEFVTTSSYENQFGTHHFDAYSSSLPLSIHGLSERMSRSIDIGPDRHLIDLLGKSNETPQQSQRLSLSLGSVPCGQRILNPTNILNSEIGFDPYDGTGYLNQTPLNHFTNQSFVNGIGNSKYLQPAQSLLQEMLSLGGESIDKSNNKYLQKLSKKGPFCLSTKLKSELSNHELVCEKHGDYVKLIKLIALLEEVERRYEEYSHHMDNLVHSFEAVAGLGASESYTGLALLAMSKHFCRLRNAIAAQIHSTKIKIAKDMPRISSRLSQLSFLDQEGRQNRGSMQNFVQAWRPLRGLPETSVTILRAWLFEHFLHPYPNDSEKLMLASQTGLSKNQVSNWFINARVRLWKPMIEEMYKEEFEESSTESDQLVANSSTDLGD